MPRLPIVLLLTSMILGAGCASAPHPSSTTIAPPPDDLRRLAIVVTGESRFAVVGHASEPGRTFDEILRWHPYAATLRPVAALVHSAINWLLELDDATDTKAHVRGLAPAPAIAEAFARRLEASGRFEARALDREPVGAERPRADAIVRLAVPTWGLVRVREGDPDLVSAFADVRVQALAPGTGAILWEAVEDVTGAERAPMQAFTRDREFARHELRDVVERAGRRLASELLYARGTGR
jgi:hypothetical protein